MRIPWQVHKDQKGYIDDRRPNANMDPYVVTRLIIETVCGSAEGDLEDTLGAALKVHEDVERVRERKVLEGV